MRKQYYVPKEIEKPYVAVKVNDGRVENRFSNHPVAKKVKWSRAMLVGKVNPLFRQLNEANIR